MGEGVRFEARGAARLEENVNVNDES